MGALVFLLLGGCAGTFHPRPLDTAQFLSRAQTREVDGVRVSTAVPDAGETRALFGAPLYQRGVQPVWVKIENGRDEVLTFLPAGIDRTYFTPIEAANLDLVDMGQTDRAVNRYFFDRGMAFQVGPGQTRSGFLFTSLEEGTKAFNVDVRGEQALFTFTFFVPVPGLRIDHHEVDWENLYPPGRVSPSNEAGLINALEGWPCCTTDKNAKGAGDPLNLVVIGKPEAVYTAFLRAGWDETETIYGGSIWKTVGSFLSGEEYRYSPVSALYAFGRAQDVAFQKARSNINQRNHLRLWLSPLRFEGEPVWLGQISRDIGVRFTWKTITTHKIDPDVDETREYLLEDLAYAQALRKFGYVEGVGVAPPENPRGNLTGDPYFTDGHRLVLWVTSSPTDLADLEFAPWAVPPDRKSGVMDR